MLKEWPERLTLGGDKDDLIAHIYCGDEKFRFKPVMKPPPDGVSYTRTDEYERVKAERDALKAAGEAVLEEFIGANEPTLDALDAAVAACEATPESPS